jgi:hypothetical protein
MDNNPTSCVLVLLMTIDVVVVVLLRVPLRSFYIKGVGLTRTVLESVIIVVLLELYL